MTSSPINKMADYDWTPHEVERGLAWLPATALEEGGQRGLKPRRHPITYVGSLDRGLKLVWGVVRRTCSTIFKGFLPKIGPQPFENDLIL